MSGCISDALQERLGVDFLPTCVTADHPSDVEVLVALYKATDGTNWEDNDNWLSDAPIGEWHGVATDANGRAVGLSLSDNNLVGEIPVELVRLANLRTLDLGQNGLVGEIPPELGNLTILEDLDLSDNSLSGEMPPELGLLVHLEDLDLRDNSLSGEIPPELLVLFYLSLEDLRLDGNQLIGCLLECVATDRPGDAEVLASLYNGTDGPNWHDGDNWLSATPITEWHGVYTDANGPALSGSGL